MSDSKLIFQAGDLIPIKLEIIEVDHGDDRPYRVRIERDTRSYESELFESYWIQESEILLCNIDPEYLETTQAKRRKERLAALREQRSALEEIASLQKLIDAESEGS